MRRRLRLGGLAAGILIAGAAIAGVAVAARRLPAANRPTSALSSADPASPDSPAKPPEDELWLSPDRVAPRAGAHLARAAAADLPRPLVLGGRIDFDDQRIAHVFSPVSGRVSQILVRLGQQVASGTTLARIVSPDVGGALADEVKARADLVAAEHDWVRQKRLLAAGAAAGRDFESAEDTWRRAEAEERRARQRVALLQRGRVDAVTQELALASPIAGRVIARSVNPGIEVQGQFAGGTAVELFTVGSTDSVWLYADVAETDLPAVRVGAPLTARVLAWPDRAFAGTIDWVSPTLDPVLRTARVRCALRNPEGLLKPQMFAAVAVARPPRRGLAVPRGAVARIHDQSFAYVLAGRRPDGRLVFRRRRIETPAAAGAVSRERPAAAAQDLLPLVPPAEQVEVLSGLTAGEQVLVEGGAARDPAVAASGDDAGGARSGAAGGGRQVAVSGEQLRSGQVAVAPVEAAPVADLLAIGGRLAFDELRVAHVFSPVGGRITRVLAAPGQRVARGAPLAVIESPELGSAFADTQKARADLDTAAHEAQRQRELAALKVGVERDREAADDNLLRAQAEYDRAAQRTRLLRADGGTASGAGVEGGSDRTAAVAQQFVLRSPIAGQVTARLASLGLEVQGQYSGGGNVVELFTIGDASRLWLLGDLYEMDLPCLQPGDAVRLEVAAWPGRRFAGTVDWVSDVVDPVTRTVKVRCVLDNSERRLAPEMYGTARLEVPARRALAIPREALLRHGDATVVFVAAGSAPGGGMRFRLQPVVAREELAGGRVPILAGLVSGDRVAAHGAIFLLGMLR